MAKIVPIVEGNGETEAVPALLYKILHALGRYDVQVARSKNAHGCNNLTKAGGIERFVELAWMERDCIAVLILLDADDQCPKNLAEQLTARIGKLGAMRSVVVVCANREYEAWFLASLETIAGHDLDGRPGLPAGLTYTQEVEALRGAKGWLSAHLPDGRSYKETEDQVVMTRLIDTEKVKERSRSFRRLWHAVEQILEAMEGEKVVVTP